MIAVQAEPFDAALLLADFSARAAGAGAIASFTGMVRDENDGAAVSGLTLDHHPRLTEKVIAGIGADAARRFDLTDIMIVHRYGAMIPGEAIVFAAAAAPHRRAAFDAVDYVMDRLKTEAPFWKREQRSDGAHWLEARASDVADRRRWDEEQGKVSVDFVPVRIAVLTVSDTRNLETDGSGGYLAGAVETAGHVLAARAIVPDDAAQIRAAVQFWVDDPAVDVVITTGGTGLTGRDVTPEAVAPLFDKVIEGFAAVFHAISFQSVGLSTIQSRACAGVADGTFIFCLPGSGGAVRDGWEKVIVHQLDARTRPCNLVEIMPRLGE